MDSPASHILGNGLYIHSGYGIAIGDKPKNPKGGIFIIDGSEQ